MRAGAPRGALRDLLSPAQEFLSRDRPVRLIHAPIVKRGPREGEYDHEGLCTRIPGPRRNPTPSCLVELPQPKPAAGEVLVRVDAAVRVCRTDLHVVEGELAPRKSPIVPGHQVVGVVEREWRPRLAFPTGARAWAFPGCTDLRRLRILPWRAREPVASAPCSPAGWWMAATPSTSLRPEDFVYPLPEGFSDLHVGAAAVRRHHRASAPCGFPACGRVDASPKCTASAPPRTSHPGGRHWTSASTHVPATRAIASLALDLARVGRGGRTTQPSRKNSDAALIFAPPGELVAPAPRALKRGAAVLSAAFT